MRRKETKFPNITFIKKKKIFYKRFIINLLNFYHGFDGNSKYWTPIIDIWLEDILFHIHYKIISYKKNNISNFNKKENNFFFKEPSDVRRALYEEEFNLYLNNVIKNFISKKKINNILYENKNFFSKRKDYSISYIYINFIKKLISLYIFLVKPVVIMNGYFGYKNSVKIFFYSFGKIIILPSHYILNKDIDNNSIDISYRNKINLKKKDFFDKIFVHLLRNLLPMSFLENYKTIKKHISFYYNNISKLGTANLHLTDGYFKILLAEFLKKNKTFFIFQHGGFWNTCKYWKPSFFERKICNNNYYWNNKFGLGFNYLSRFKKIEIKSLLKNRKIFFFGSQGRIEGVNDMLIPLKIFNKNYFYNPVKFYKKLDENLKLYYNYRPPLSTVNKKIINKMKKISNVEINSSVEKILNEARVIILDAFSTTFYECLYKGIPIIIIADVNNFNFKETYINILLKLMNKMIFNSPEKAAIFLNKNYDNLIDWWNNLYNSDTMKDLRDYLYTEDSNFCKKITFELKKKNPLKYTKKIF